MMLLTNYLGNNWDVASFTVNDICFTSIYNSLRRLPRFGGHTTLDYSVLKHTMLGCRLCDVLGHSEETKLAFFIHDFSEAIMGFDAPTPIKIECANLVSIENKIQDVFYDHYKLKYSQTIKDIDYLMGYLECKYVTAKPADERGWELPNIELDYSKYSIVTDVMLNEYKKDFIDEYETLCNLLETR